MDPERTFSVAIENESGRESLKVSREAGLSVAKTLVSVDGKEQDGEHAAGDKMWWWTE